MIPQTKLDPRTSSSGVNRRRIEALVDGTTVVEGTTTMRRTGDHVTVRPDYVRAAMVTLGADGTLLVRPRAERDADDDSTLEPMPRSTRLRTSDFCELWLDGRLVHMTR